MDNTNQMNQQARQLQKEMRQSMKKRKTAFKRTVDHQSEEPITTSISDQKDLMDIDIPEPYFTIKQTWEPGLITRKI